VRAALGRAPYNNQVLSIPDMHVTVATGHKYSPLLEPLFEITPGLYKNKKYFELGQLYGKRSAGTN
jgi:hypothetical protein